MASTSSILLSRSAENPSQSAFFRLKRLLNVVGCATITGFTLTQIGRCCVWGVGLRTDFSHIFETTTTHTHSRTIGMQTGHNSLQTPRLISTTTRHTPCKHHLHKHHSTRRQTQHSKRQDTLHMQPIPEHRNNIRAQNASDPSISELNSEIPSIIQTDNTDI